MARPEHYPYSFKALLDVPRRLFHPPPAEIKVGRVRSLLLTPLFEVKLNDVLDGQHLPPLSKKDFEEYLLFVEHSPENLYFLQWLRDYVRIHDAWVQSGTAYSPQLALSWSRAKETFFTPGAHLRLNLSAFVVDDIIGSPDDASLPSGHSHYSYSGPTHASYPPPPALAKVRREVEDMLRESLARFVCGSCGNSGRARGLFGIALGVITLAIGLAPVLMSVLAGRGGRGLRVAAIPIFWLGAWITIMSLHGVCLVIFLFGDARQLYPYELARPKITSPVPKLGGPTASSSPGDTPTSEKPRPASQPDDQLYVDLERGQGTSYASTASVDHKPTPQPVPGEARPLSPLSPSSRGDPSPVVSGHDSGHRWSFDFDALPTAPPTATSPWTHPPEHERAPGGIPTFGPLTRVLSPIVTRAQWEIVVRSALMAIVVAAILGAVCLAVPPRR